MDGPSSPNLSNPPPRPVALRQLDPNLVPGEKPGEVGAGAIGNVGQDLGPVLELNPVHAVGERLQDDPLHE